MRAGSTLSYSSFAGYKGIESRKMHLHGSKMRLCTWHFLTVFWILTIFFVKFQFLLLKNRGKLWTPSVLAYPWVLSQGIFSSTTESWYLRAASWVEVDRALRFLLPLSLSLNLHVMRTAIKHSELPAASLWWRRNTEADLPPHLEQTLN